MPRLSSGLNDTFIKNLSRKNSKQVKFADGGGLYIHLSESGSKLWRMSYRFEGKQKMLCFGQYPAISLRQARLLRDNAKELLANGLDPMAEKKALKEAKSAIWQNTFEIVAREWFAKNAPNWTEQYSKRLLNTIQKNLFLFLGSRAIYEITSPELLKVLRSIEDRGALETAHRVLQTSGRIFRYAVATGRCEYDITASLQGALPPVKVKHFASITEPKKVGELLRAIDNYDGQFWVVCALKLSPLFFLRPSELRKAEWSEFDFDAKEWRIPANRMKMRVQHLVPLSKQALKILKDLQPLTGNGRYLFPSLRTTDRPMSENTVNAALRRLGYSSEEMTGHGFRSMASTLLNEIGYNRDWIERQLAHGDRDSVRSAYNYAEWLPERRNMMQEWSDYLDNLKATSSCG